MENQEQIWKIFEETTDLALKSYDQMISLGVCPEQARAVLPLTTYTEWVWTGSVLGWSRMFNLRSAPDAQKEVQEIASMVSDVIEPLFPVSWEALATS